MIDAVQTVNIDDVNQEERQKLLVELVKWAVGPLPLDDGSGRQFLPLFFESVKPGIQVPFSVMSHATFKPERLIILEPTVEVVETDEILEFETVFRETGWWWTKKREPVKSLKERRIVNRRTWRKLDRSVWNVNGVFFGNKCQFPSQGKISGDAFSPDGELAFDGSTLSPGLSITIGLSHSVGSTVPFYGVVLGQGLKW